MALCSRTDRSSEALLIETHSLRLAERHDYFAAQRPSTWRHRFDCLTANTARAHRNTRRMSCRQSLLRLGMPGWGHLPGGIPISGKAAGRFGLTRRLGHLFANRFPAFQLHVILRSPGPRARMFRFTIPT